MTHSSAAFFLPGSFSRCCSPQSAYRKCSNVGVLVRLPGATRTSCSSSFVSATTTDPTSSLHASLTPTSTSMNDLVVFEPVLNVPALGTFLFVMAVFGLLSIRTSQVEQAVQERNSALKELREAKSKELSGGAEEVNVQKSLERFDKAMEKEDNLRTIIPGVRIVPPSNGNKAEEEARVAARQFLNKEVNIGAGSSSKQEEGDGRLPMAALGVLALLATSLVALLVFLSLDPVTSNNVLDNFGGNINNNFI